MKFSVEAITAVTTLVKVINKDQLPINLFMQYNRQVKEMSSVK